jgi:RNA polymerase sigma-70 factor (ECF subfamily)
MWQGVNTIAGASVTPDLRAEPDPDAQLMLHVRDGDDNSFRVLLEKHRNSLVYFLYRMVQDQPVSEELAQEVFLRIYKTRATYEPTAKFTTWMFRIANHLALNWLRDEKHSRAEKRLDDDKRGQDGGNLIKEVADRKPTAEQRMLRDARLQEIREAIALLPEKQRAAVLMHKYEEMEYVHIAGVLECSESAVKSLLFRAYETLRARLAHMATGGHK